ncbi:wall-associated receptor kinase-like 5 [Spodoptera litura]|uniref:Wall-associated receptor kinase-like 5 n=1 Tax=Spodoptera litura TaxID=69820 RepID=A0A9J7IX36_SPOLT|nr:wall-associated receptor kinase-like 5 [Spodoptera litura]
MQYFSLVLFCCLVSVSFGVNHNDNNKCLFDKQCSLLYGDSCICYKGGAYYGKCYCSVDLGCLKNEDCKGKGKPNQICVCLNNKGKGECSCYDPLYSPRSGLIPNSP